MTLSTENELVFNNQRRADLQLLAEQVRFLTSDLTVMLGAIDALLALWIAKGATITDDDLANLGITPTEFLAAIDVLATISTSAKAGQNNWVMILGRLAQANQLRSANR
jgi:hypothetical protein